MIKDMKKLLSVILLLASVSGMLLSCEKAPEKFSEYSFDYFDTATSIVGYETSRERFNERAKQILTMLGEYHRLYTIYNSYDDVVNICTLNKTKGENKRTIKADAKIIDMLEYAREAYAKTNGKVNVAMGSVLSIWHDYREEGMDEPWNAQLPPIDRLKAAAEHTDIEKLRIDNDAMTVTLLDPEMTLDVGAIAKGYAVEMIARTLESEGVSGYVLNVGGNVRTIGTKPDGSGWKVGIENPDRESEDGYLEYLSLKGQALVTSGSYQRYYTVDGVDYHHIIDPGTLMPSDYFISVSIVCSSSALGDALSTALFTMSLEEGRTLIASIPEAEAMWVEKDGTKHYSDGFRDYITE